MPYIRVRVREGHSYLMVKWGLRICYSIGVTHRTGVLGVTHTQGVLGLP